MFGKTWSRMFSRGGRSFNRFTTKCGSARGQTRLNSGAPNNPTDPKIKTDNSSFGKILNQKNKNLAMYMTATGIAVVGVSYASVPLYRLFCSVTGYGGTTQSGTEAAPAMNSAREITINFTSHVSDTLPWSFKPAQKSVEIVPGETVLAFYEATNKTEKPIIGIATYNVTPSRVGLYFTKIQCFCFDEQRLNPKETVMMPVLFYIHPDMLDDKLCDGVTNVTLSYTFFLANDQNAHLQGLEAAGEVQAAAAAQ